MKHNYGSLFPQLFPSLIWRKQTKSNVIYLTFDDGPIPEVTEWVLDLLKEEKVEATFFCVGNNIQKHPQIYNRLIEEGHASGNHTYNHMNGRKVDSQTYFENIEKCEPYLHESDRKRLYRPPYGKLTFSQIRKLSKQYEVIMWDVLSGDFSQTINPQYCLDVTLKYSQKGSIVVFHDNIKSFETLQYVLPKYIKEMKNRGFTFRKL